MSSNGPGPVQEFFRTLPSYRKTGDWEAADCPSCGGEGLLTLQGTTLRCVQCTDQELAEYLFAAPAKFTLRIVTLDQFAAVDEPGATAILGTDDNAVIPEGADAMVYGDGGVGKTTLCVDLVCHLAAGLDWLGLNVQRAVRCLLIENEGPRPLFRRKLKRKLAGWAGPPLEGRVEVLEDPWGQLDLADPAWRQALGRELAGRKTDVLVVGPVTTAGMEGAGTIAEARAFLALVGDVRTIAGRPVAVLLVHHENKGGKVSGAWEGAGDTLLHVQQQGHGQVRLYFQKARWASEQHATTLQLAWAKGDSFTAVEVEATSPEHVWETLEEFVRHHGGCTWNVIKTARNDDGTKVVRGQLSYLAQRRDQMLTDGVLINAGKRGTFELWHRDDPARPQLFEDTKQVFPEAETLGKHPGSTPGDGDQEGGCFPTPRSEGSGNTHLPPPPAADGPFPGPFPDPPDDDLF